MSDIENQINGSLSVFCDISLRADILWSVEQAFIEYLKWTGEPGKSLSPNVFLDEKHKNIALQFLSNRLSNYERPENSLVIESVYSYQYDRAVSDIRYGWRINSIKSRKTANRMKKSEMPKLEKAFTVAHANEYIKKSGEYNDLIELLNNLSKSHIEKLFFNEWIKRFYSQDSPALIPEIHAFSLSKEGCGTRRFVYQKDKSIVKARIDFLIYNAKKGIACFIELDGHSTHKSIEDRHIDALKRNIIADAGLPLYVFTSQMVLNDIDSCFKEIEAYTS